MTESLDPQDPLAPESEAFFEKLERTLRDLFDRARARNELHFALSLNPEFRGEQGPGWSTADDAHRAFDEYLAFLREGEFTSLKARVALAFYCHLAEASGYYEIPKLRWSLTSLQQRPFKTGGRLIRYARYFALQLAESCLTVSLFRQMLQRIERLAWHPT